MKAVVFDFGGVLFQWKPLQLLQQALPELAPDEAAAKALAAQVFESFTPQSDWARFDLGQIDETSLAQRIAQRVGATPEQIRAVIDAIPPHLVPQAASVALVHSLKAAGHRMFFLSNMPVPYADHLEREHGFIGAFEDGIFSGRVGLMKPDAPIFELAEKRFGLVPEQTVFIDDHAGNIDTARARGWQGLQFQSAAQCADGLRAQGWL
jgi:putative hydrolase of the HAD superfamily